MKGILRVDTVTYTGVTGDGVKRREFDLKMEPEGKEVIKMLVTFDEYYKKLVDQVNVTVMGTEIKRSLCEAFCSFY